MKLRLSLALFFFTVSLFLLQYVGLNGAIPFINQQQVGAQSNACFTEFPGARCLLPPQPGLIDVGNLCGSSSSHCYIPGGYGYPAPGGGYGYPAPGGGYGTPYGTPYGYPYPAPPPPRFDVTGNVFIDNNRNGVRDGGEGPYVGATLTMTGGGGTTTSNGNGDYAFNNFLAGTYTVTLSGFPAWYVPSTATSRTTTLGPNRVLNFGLVPVFAISGFVYNDINKNQVKDGAETKDWPANITVTATTLAGAPSGNLTIDQNTGFYQFRNLFAGTYVIRYTSAIPTGYLLLRPVVGPPPAWQVNVGPCNFGSSGAGCFGAGDVINLNFAITNSIPWMQTYGLDVRFDNGLTDIIPIDPIYPPYVSVASKLFAPPPPPTPILVGQGFVPATGAPSVVNGLTIGQPYRIVVSGIFEYSNVSNPHLVSDAQWSNVGTGVPNCFCVRTSQPHFNGVWGNAQTLGPTFDPSHTYTYQWSANSTQLAIEIGDSNFADNTGGLNYQVWYDPPPPAPPTGQSVTPGIVFTGDGSANFGNGHASSSDWLAGGPVYPEVFPATTQSQINYQYLLSKATDAGVTITNLTTVAGCATLSNCTLPANLPNGVYQANGDVTLNGYTFPDNRSYVFLINGTLTIQGNIVIPNGATAFFNTTRDIIITSGVGAPANTSPLPDGQIEGVFTADRNFIIQGINNCLVGADKMLDVEGAIVTNAAGAGGTLTNNRDLCGGNPDFPSFTILQRVDFLLNAPSFISSQRTLFREDAP